jgi:hypothetical protein
MSETWLAVIAVAVAVMAITQVAVSVVAVRAALQALAIVKRLETELRPALADVRSLSADAARSAALLASQAERVDQLASRVTHRFDEFTASPLRDGLALLRTIVETFLGNREPRSTAPRERRPGPQPADDAPV